MMKKFKKGLCLMLAALMCISTMSVESYAEVTLENGNLWKGDEVSATVKKGTEEYDFVSFYDGAHKTYEMSNYVVSNEDGIQIPQLLVMVEAGEEAETTWEPNGLYSQGESNYDVMYCCDAETGYKNDIYYKRTNLEDSEYYTAEDAARIRAIVKDAYPYVTMAEMKANLASEGFKDADKVTRSEAITAVQAAVWSYSNVEVDPYSYHGAFHIPDNLDRGGVMHDYTAEMGDVWWASGKNVVTSTGEKNEEVKERVNRLIEHLEAKEGVAATDNETIISVLDMEVASASVNDVTKTYVVTLNITLNNSGSGEEDDLKITVTAGDNVKEIPVVYGQTEYSCEIAAQEDDVIKAVVSGTQVVPGGVYFYAAEPTDADGDGVATSRETSQSGVCVTDGEIAIHAEDSIDVSEIEDTGNLILDKEVWLEDNGTYTVQLEAYAKGQVSVETLKVVQPADIILVLDQSGSMDQEEVEGIPTDSYTRTSNVTNADLVENSYYYRVDNEYYRLITTKEIVTSKVEYVDNNGTVYTEEQLSSSYELNGVNYTTSTQYATASLETWTRESQGSGWNRQYRYVNGAGETTSWASSTNARNALVTRYANNYGNNYTVEFQGSNGYAAAYIPVNKQEHNTVWYSYKYIDAEGNEVSLGHTETNEESVISAEVCGVSPLYIRGTEEGTRLEALKYAAEEFVENIKASAIKNNIHHRVAIVGFASDESSNYDEEYYYSNSELFIGATQYNYYVGGQSSTHNEVGSLASNMYGSAFQDILAETGYNNLLASVDNLAAKGGTHPSLGFEMANGIFGANSNVEADGTERTRIVIFLTDGQPGDSGFSNSEATATYTQVETIKETYGANVYAVAVLDSTPATNNDTFLKTVSSSGNYTLVTEAEALHDFFETVDKDINNTSTTVTLSEDAIVLDRFSNYFKVPEGFNTTDNMTVQVAKHLGYELFDTPTAAPATVEKWLSYGLGDEGDEDREIKGVSAREFNFISPENVVTTTVVDNEEGEDAQVVANGYKLIITITGLLAKDDAATDTYIDTNTTDAGVWDTDENGEFGVVKPFEMPHTLLKKDAFVIDYAKEAELKAFGLSANRVDSDADAIFSKVEESATSLTETYGKVAVANNKLTYEPTKMNWDGFDTFYALGKDANYGDRKTQNLWKKISVIPANNVYYEDDFVTNTTEGTVGIVYSGEWSVEGTSAGNKEIASNPIHGGWHNTDLADDETYTDGTAHAASTQGATATFTFTGTGVDIYTRTNMQTGLVKAQLYKGTEAKAAMMTQTYVIDNLAVSGDYYQIPTATFKDLQHGTYTVKLTVASKAEGETTRSIYYLDGIRVYNPLSAQQQAGELVSGLYGEEAGAMFREVRDILIDSTRLDAGTADTTDGVVFIDKMADGTVAGSTSVVGTYVEYGPKNEVYLAKDQAIAFYMAGGSIHVGLKAPEGATTAQVTNGESTSPLDINASSDLYYKVVPNEDGLVMIKNTGDNLLAITKLKATVAGMVGEVSVASVLDYANTFDSLPVIDWELESEENIPDVDDKEDVTPEDGNTGNVEIENPEPETDMTREQEILRQLMKQILGLFRNWLVK